MSGTVTNNKFFSFWIVVVLLNGCASTKVHNEVTVSESLFSPTKVSLPGFSGSLTAFAKEHPVDGENLERLDFYRRLSFFIGSVGGIYSFIADKQGYVTGRTFGNALWGIGWTSWIGIGAVIRADVRQSMDAKNETVDENFGEQSSSLTSDTTWTLVWRLGVF